VVGIASDYKVLRKGQKADATKIVGGPARSYRRFYAPIRRRVTTRTGESLSESSRLAARTTWISKRGQKSESLSSTCERADHSVGRFSRYRRVQLSRESSTTERFTPEGSSVPRKKGGARLFSEQGRLKGRSKAGKIFRSPYADEKAGTPHSPGGKSTPRGKLNRLRVRKKRAWSHLGGAARALE